MSTYGEPFYGSVGPEVQEESNIFSELLSNIYLGYWGQAIRLSTWIATNKLKLSQTNMHFIDRDYYLYY